MKTLRLSISFRITILSEDWYIMHKHITVIIVLPIVIYNIIFSMNK